MAIKKDINLSVVTFLGIKVEVLTKHEIVEKILEFSLTGKGKFITYLNAHCINISFSDYEYRDILQKADLVYAGGQGIVWATKFLGTPLPERVNILDFFNILSQKLIEKRVKIYLLGSYIDVVKKAEEVLKSKGLNIIGSSSGFFDAIKEKEIIQEIKALKPDILIIGMGVPKQEKWVNRYSYDLNVNLCWAVGAAFEWLSGIKKRAPRWMIRYGFEWLHRLYQDPSRFWKRYLIGNPLFVYYVFKDKFKKI